MENRLYTREEVLSLLEKQRKKCYKKAKIRCAEYVNPYSESDGEKEYYIDEKSILEAKINID